MPIFEFQCDQCESIEEVLELNKTESHEKLPCPNCGEGVMHKIISASNIVDRANIRISKKRKRVK